MCCGTCGCRRLRENIIRCISSEKSSDLGSILIAKSAVFIWLVHRIKNCVTICYWNWKQTKGEFLYCWRPPFRTPSHALRLEEKAGSSHIWQSVPKRVLVPVVRWYILLWTLVSHIWLISVCSTAHKFRVVCIYILLWATIRIKEDLAFNQLTNVLSSFLNKAILWDNHLLCQYF